MGRLLSILVVLWFVVGAFAAFQRGYFSNAETNCSAVSDTVLTVVAGPLNYFGVNPKIDCGNVGIDVPEPSE